MKEEKNIEFCRQCQEKGLQNKILKFSTIQSKNTSLFFCSSRQCPVHFFKTTSNVVENKNESKKITDNLYLNDTRRLRWGRLWMAKKE